MKYQTLQDILKFPSGTIIVVEDDMGSLGVEAWGGWKIPLFILEKNKDWFVEIQS